MPRAGVTAERIVQTAAELADELGFANLTLQAIAERLGVSAPSLYKHVKSLGDLQRRVAVLAMKQMDEQVRDGMLGKSGRDALGALVAVSQDYVAAHPGRYASTVGAELDGPDDPLVVAGARLVEAIAAVLRGYGIPDEEMVHAIRTVRCTLHGFATLGAANGFQWAGDPQDTLKWMTGFLDRGLSGARLEVPTNIAS